MQSVIQASRRFKLDYDDAYQYALAEKYNLILVSFDGDFDRTKRGKATPADIFKLK
jgi:predicted nucleic acid-binding protein